MNEPTTPNERLEILLHYLRQSAYWNDKNESLIRWGFLVGQPNGDDHIAKNWIENYRNNGQ